MKHSNRYSLQCPIPKSDYEHVLLAHGGGGKLTQDLIDRMRLMLYDTAQFSGAIRGGRFTFPSGAVIEKFTMAGKGSGSEPHPARPSAGAQAPLRSGTAR